MLTARARLLIQKQAVAPTALTALYDEELGRLAASLSAIQREIASGRAARVGSASRDTAISTVRAGSPGWFWAQPEVAQNQLLHALLDGARLQLAGGRITGVSGC